MTNLDATTMVLVLALGNLALCAVLTFFDHGPVRRRELMEKAARGAEVDRARHRRSSLLRRRAWGACREWALGGRRQSS